jgi:hypothetical protein
MGPRGSHPVAQNPNFWPFFHETKTPSKLFTSLRKRTKSVFVGIVMFLHFAILLFMVPA